MARLTRKDVDDIALLARLALGDDESERLQEELSQILGHMELLAGLDTDSVEPMTHPVPMTLRLRDDAVQPSLTAEEATAPAADRSDTSFRVPHIIKTSGG